MIEHNKSGLYNLIQMSQLGDKDSLLNIIAKFKPLICKLAKRLNYEEAETDLVISLIETIKSLNLSNFSGYSEGQLVKYIYNSLNNKCIDLFRKFILIKNEDLELNLDVLQIQVDIDTKIIVEELLNLDILTKRQKEVLKRSYLYSNTDSEIGKIFSISRQAVNKIKNRGIHVIRNYLNLA